MSEQVQKSKSTQKREDTLADTGSPAGTKRREKLSADVDDLLDEIDTVLEPEAEEFVAAYVQKGGE